MKRFFLFLAAIIPMVAGAGPRAWVAVGDSITKGWDQVTTPYPVRLAALRGHPVDDMGIGGDVAANIYARWQRYAKPYQYAGVIIEECINDLNGGARHCPPPQPNPPDRRSNAHRSLPAVPRAHGQGDRHTSGTSSAGARSNRASGTAPSGSALAQPHVGRVPAEAGRRRRNYGARSTQRLLH